MESVLLVLQLIIAAALIGMVLLQRSDTDGFGLGSGGGSNLLSGRATANLLTRTTAILATLFILNSLALSILAAHNRPPSIVDAIETQQTKETFGAPAVPLAGADKGAKSEKAPVVTEKPPAPLPTAPVKKHIVKTAPAEAAPVPPAPAEKPSDND